MQYYREKSTGNYVFPYSKLDAERHYESSPKEYIRIENEPFDDVITFESFSSYEGRPYFYSKKFKMRIAILPSNVEKILLKKDMIDRKIEGRFVRVCRNGSWGHKLV